MQIDRPIVIGLIICIILLLVFFLVIPEYNTFGDLQTQLGEKMAEYVGQYDYYNAIDTVWYTLQSEKDNIGKIDDALPQDPTLGKTIYFLQQTAQKNGLVVKDLFLSKSSSANNAVGGGTTKDIVFSINVSGDYPSLEGFITALENSSRIFEITSITFDSKTGPPYGFSLQIKTYSY
jgi:Tfp pilus assembly protein PilO